MKRTFLGEFEEIVLLTVGVLEDNAYGASVTKEIENQAGRVVGFNTVHVTLQRLEDKGFLKSQVGGATAERGGRRKRLFSLTPSGATALGEIRVVRLKLWEALPAKTMALLNLIN
ncbi:MAG TPA: PadR family transcriptional regulator [Chlamydiales bacterium]|jgi:DNA-binding PadR family transcriptional regulator|nr:PadR family transcriptional regulator [Chlamydiales bacterium]